MAKYDDHLNKQNEDIVNAIRNKLKAEEEAEKKVEFPEEKDAEGTTNET